MVQTSGNTLKVEKVVRVGANNVTNAQSKPDLQYFLTRIQFKEHIALLEQMVFEC